ncbi:MAG: radical SAM protein [Kiritimatiellae bacterium]|nr:radical SAM protein [Kiritimatiellia bacterium]
MPLTCATSTSDAPTLALVSLGCAKNAVDLQLMAGRMLKAGWRLSADPDRADAVIVNTCSFIASAREESEREIRRALELKRRGAYSRVIVSGCYPQRYPGAVAAFPGVDEWIGVPGKWEEQKVQGLRLTGRAFAYLKIAEGCAHRCSYCAIPSIRGAYRSRPMRSILREARALVATGCRELNVIAQDPMMWRDGKRRLADLLWALDRIPGRFWVRVLYSYPSEIDGDFVYWLMTAKHAAKYVDMPIQHTVPEVLAKMNRRRTAEAVECLADDLRLLVPDVTLRTTVLVGFPGETEARFRRLLSDVARMQFDHLGAFAYSPERGTKGAKLGGRPSQAAARSRERQVMELQRRIWDSHAGRLVGKVLPALVVAPGVARLESQAPDVDGVTRIDCADPRLVGEFVKVEISGVDGFDFVAKVVRGRGRARK